MAVEAVYFVFNWLREWAPVIGAIGSLVLSGALVYLYRIQTRILNEQRKLLTHETNREVRRSHTETLRDRVIDWHGETVTDADAPHPTQRDNSLPAVFRAEVIPAESETLTGIGEDPEFRIVPERIEKDRYLQDLLENHAPNLRQLKEKIESKYEEYDALRLAFLEEYGVGKVELADGYRLEPTTNLNDWAFEQAVLLNRDRPYYDCEKLLGIAEDGVDNTPMGDPDMQAVLFQGGTGQNSPYVYRTVFEEYPPADDIRNEAKQQVVNLLQEVIRDINYEPPFDKAEDAAQLLDSIEEDIDELEQVLIEYEGQPIYPGDCKYLKEARYDSS